MMLQRRVGFSEITILFERKVLAVACTRAISYVHQLGGLRREVNLLNMARIMTATGMVSCLSSRYYS